MKHQIYSLFVGINLLFLKHADTQEVSDGPLKTVNGPKYENANISIISLGSVDGKSYYVDKEEKRTWKKSLTLCTSLEMELGTATLESEMIFLKAALDLNTFNGTYWTAGGDQQNVGQFSGDKLGWGGIPLTVLENGMEKKDNLTCLIYITNDSRYEFRECTETHFTLCEISSEKQVTSSTPRPPRPVVTAKATRMSFSVFKTFAVLIYYILKVH